MQKYFVMLRHPQGFPMPLISGGFGQDKVKLFDSEEEAKYAGKDNGLGEAYGFEVFEWMT